MRLLTHSFSFLFCFVLTRPTHIYILFLSLKLEAGGCDTVSDAVPPRQFVSLTTHSRSLSWLAVSTSNHHLPTVNLTPLYPMKLSFVPLILGAGLSEYYNLHVVSLPSSLTPTTISHFPGQRCPCQSYHYHQATRRSQLDHLCSSRPCRGAQLPCRYYAYQQHAEDRMRWLAPSESSEDL